MSTKNKIEKMPSIEATALSVAVVIFGVSSFVSHTPSVWLSFVQLGLSAFSGTVYIGKRNFFFAGISVCLVFTAIWVILH